MLFNGESELRRLLHEGFAASFYLLPAGRGGYCFGFAAVAVGICVINPSLAATSQPTQAANHQIKQVHNAATASQKPASIHGSIRAAVASASLKNAEIVVTSARGQRFELHPDKSGNFAIGKLQPGSWTVVASADEMLGQTRSINLKSGEDLALDFALQEFESTDTLSVKARRDLIHPDVASDSTFIDKNIIQNYKSGNDLRDVIATAPGVQQDSFGNMLVRGEHNTINYVLDDVVIPEAVGQLQMGQVVSPHSLRSVEVTTGGFQASAGGGPMGAVVDMTSLPIKAKPTAFFAGQLGGPIQGGLNYYASTAVSQDQGSKWNRVRVESSGQIFSTKLGIEPPSRHFTRDGRMDINSLSRVEWTPTESDRFKVTVSINETWMHIPTPYIARQYGFKENQHDRQNYVILSHRHLFDSKFIDESNIHLLTGFYSQRLGSTNRFNPAPVINGEEQSFVSASPTGKRYNFIFSAQGDVRKTVLGTHHLKAGFYSEVRPVKTYFSSFYYDASPNSQTYGQLISPFTGMPGGPQIWGNVGKYRGFRYLQSAYFQDKWTPQKGALHRLTVEAGARFDLYHGVFGNTRNIANAIAPFVGAANVEGEGDGAVGANNQFLLRPFQTNRVTNAQMSGRFAAAYKLTSNLVARGSFAQVFTPPPVDLLPRPFNINDGTINGIFNGSLRPMQASRGYIVDSSLEQQVGQRISVKSAMFYKQLHNQGDELPVNNTLLYQRLTLSRGELYGVETRLDLKPRRDGTGLFGFASNTVSVAKLEGNHKVSGGIYDIDPAEVGTAKYIDHDRREVLAAALGYRAHNGLWILGEMNYYTGFLIGLDPALFGAHPARSKPFAIFGLNVGWDVPSERRKEKWAPQGINVRIQNISNNVVPINLGSVFQGTRYTLPFRLLVECKWGT